MAISQLTVGSLTVSTTELSLVSGTSTLQTDTTVGIYQLFLDLSALLAGDAFRIRVKERVDANTQNLVIDQTVAGALTDPIYATPALVLLDGWDMTIVQVGANSRAIPYSIRQVA